jgi:hypothetical protein
MEAINLSGEWIGHYAGHFDEVIWITQSLISWKPLKLPATILCRPAP